VLRNRAGVLAALIVVTALVAATAISARQARIATEQAGRAEEKSRTAEAVKDYLLSVFASANPYNPDGKVVTARDLLEGGLDQVDRKLAGQPQVQAELYAGFVETFLQLSNNVLGKRAGELALAKYRQFLPPDAVEILKVECNLAQADFYQTHFDGLVARFENLLARIGNRDGEFAAVRADVLTLLGMTHYRMGDFERAFQKSEAALAQLRKTKGKPYDYEIDILLYNLYLVRDAQGRIDEAATLIGEFTAQDRLLVGPQHPGLFTDVTSIARLMQEVGRLHDAHDLFAAAVSARRRQFPENHILAINTRAYLADDDCELGDSASESAFDELVALTAKPGIEIGATDLARILVTRAQCLLRRDRSDRFADVRRSLEQARDLIIRVSAEDSPFALVIDATHADAERRSGNPDAALNSLAPIVARQRERADRELPASLLIAAHANAAVGRYGEALAELDEARGTLVRQGRPFSTVAREVEITSAALPSATRTSAAGHWLKAAQIGCVNYGCNDGRVREWSHMGDDAAGGDPKAAAAVRPTPALAATDKPYEAQYRLALDILAKADAPGPDVRK
jgi:tetratricopeptide (TPR) repeat protein